MDTPQPWDSCRVFAGTVCEKHAGEYIIVEPVCGGRKYFCAACLFELITGMAEMLDSYHYEQVDFEWKMRDLQDEVTRLERRFLDETAAHDKTRHRLECRERELERIRSNNYRERVDALHLGVPALAASRGEE